MLGCPMPPSPGSPAAADDALLARALTPLLSSSLTGLDAPAVGSAICGAVVEGLGGSAVLCLLRPRGHGRTVVMAGIGPWAEDHVGGEWPLDNSLAGQALRSRVPEEIAEMAVSDHPYREGLVASGIRSARAVPLLLHRPLADGREALGTLNALRPGPGGFTEAERRLLDQIAAVTVLLLARLEWIAAAAEADLHRRVAFDVAHDLATSLDPSVIISRLLERLIEVVRADRGTVSWIEGDRMITEHSHDPVGTPVPRGQRIDYTVLPECVEAVRTGRPVFAGPVNAAALPDEQGAPYDGVRHRLLLPVIVGGRSVANVALSRRRDEPFHLEDLAVVAPLMNVAAVTLRNARLYGESERARGLATRAVDSIARHSASTTAMPTFLGRLSETMAELVDADLVAFWELDGERLRIVSEAQDAQGRLISDLADVPCSPDGGGAASRIVFGGRLRRINSELARRGRMPWVEAMGPRDALCVSWRAGDRTLGMVVALGSRREGGFTEEDGWVLGISSQAAGLVWERAEALRALTEVRDREDERLREVAERAAALESVKTRFLRLASHELRGPIAVARGYVSMLADGTLPLSGDLEPVFATIQAKLTQMNLLVDDMLENARLEDGRLELNVEPTDLGELTREVVETMRPLAGAPIRLSLEVPARPVAVVVDRRRVGTILSNLIDNAIKYSPTGGEITVRVRGSRSRCTVTVEDHGMGIGPAGTPVLFTRFGRVVTRDNGHIPGSGLGLHLARELARLHGGDVRLTSTEGVGTTVTLLLPVAA